MVNGTKPPLTQAEILLQQRKKILRLDRSLVACVSLVAVLGSLLPALADEFDVLFTIKGAAPLNDRWQACAATYVRPRVESRQSSVVIVENALRNCRKQEGRLRRFLVEKVAKRSARTVIEQLREKYRSDLITIIDARRHSD
jgi:hypothetical protein